MRPKPYKPLNLGTVNLMTLSPKHHRPQFSLWNSLTLNFKKDTHASAVRSQDWGLQGPEVLRDP